MQTLNFLLLSFFFCANSFRVPPSKLLGTKNYESGAYPRSFEEQQRVFFENGRSNEYCDALSRLPLACLDDFRCGWCAHLKACVEGDELGPSVHLKCKFSDAYVYNVPKIFSYPSELVHNWNPYSVASTQNIHRILEKRKKKAVVK